MFGRKTVLDEICRIVRFNGRANRSDLSVEAVLVGNISMFQSRTRLNSDKGRIFVIIGTADAPAYDKRVSALDSDEMCAFLWLIACIEHEKQHVMQMVDYFQGGDSARHRLFADFMCGKLIDGWTSRNRVLDSCEFDAIAKSVGKTLAHAKRFVGLADAERAIVDMYDCEKNPYAVGMATRGAEFSSAEDIERYASERISGGLHDGLDGMLGLRIEGVLVDDIVGEDDSVELVVAVLLALWESYAAAFPIANSFIREHGDLREAAASRVESSEALFELLLRHREAYNEEPTIVARCKNAVAARRSRLPLAGRLFELPTRRAIERAGEITYIMKPGTGQVESIIVDVEGARRWPFG